MKKTIQPGWLPILSLVLLFAACGRGSSSIPPTATASFGLSPSAPLQQTTVIYDDDGSPDGTVALLYLLSNPSVRVKAVSVSYGEAHPAVYIQHLGRMLDYLGFDGILLGAGQDGPLAGTNEFPEWMRQSANDFWGIPFPQEERIYPTTQAAELLVSVIQFSAQPVLLFVSGPSTNLAQALRMDPGIKEKIGAVFLMGGAVHVPGNIQELLPESNNFTAEWNIYADPQAAREVFASGLNIFLIPLDATNQVTVTRQDTRVWRQGGQAAGLAADIYDLLLTRWDTEEAKIWDLMTAAIMLQNDLCSFTPMALDVNARADDSSGQIVQVSGSPANLMVCLDPDVQRIKQVLADTFRDSR